MAAVVGIVSRRGLTIEACHKNQPNKSKLALYKPLHPLQQQVYISNKIEYTSVIEVSTVYVGVVHI